MGVDAETVVGGRGEFTVWVDDKKVSEKGWFSFPSDAKIVGAVREALASG